MQIEQLDATAVVVAMKLRDDKNSICWTAGTAEVNDAVLTCIYQKQTIYDTGYTMVFIATPNSEH